MTSKSKTTAEALLQHVEHNIWNLWENSGKHVVRVFWWCKVYSFTSRNFDWTCTWWTRRTEPIDNCAKVFTSRSWSCVLSTALIIDWFGLKKICCFSLFAFHIFSQLQLHHNCNNVQIFSNIGLLSYSRNATLIWCIQLLRKIVRFLRWETSKQVEWLTLTLDRHSRPKNCFIKANAFGRIKEFKIHKNTVAICHNH